MAIINEYFHYQDKYEKKYGKNKTLVLMQVGSFHEAYSTQSKGYNLNEIADLCNIICTKKDKKKDDSPCMLGFPSVALQKYLKVLIDNSYTIIVIDQVTPPPNPKREITGIYSPGTYIEDCKTPDSNNIVSIYMEEEGQINGSPLLCIGMVCIDLTTGKTVVHQAISQDKDKRFAIDEANRFIIINNPNEILVHRKDKKIDISQIELENKNHHIMDQFNANHTKIIYQKEFLAKVYKYKGMLSSIEYLDMERMPYAVTCLVLTLDYAYQHNNNLINNLNKPEIFQDEKHMILGNDAVYQLNIVESSFQGKGRYKSLFDVVNHTSTAVGRRYLKSMLCSPILDTKKLETSYEIVEDMLENDFFEKLDPYLKSIMDIERYHRKMSLNQLHPHEFVNLLASYQEVINVLKLLKPKREMYQIPKIIKIKKMREILEECDKTFDLEEMKKYNINDIQNSFFKFGSHTELDAIQKKINHDMQLIEESCKVLSSHVEDRFKGKKKVLDTDSEKIKVKKNERDGYFLSLTKLRAKSLKDNLAKLQSIPIMDITIKPADIMIKELDKGNSKISFSVLDTVSDQIIANRTEIMNQTKDCYVKYLDTFYRNNQKLLTSLVTFVAQIDYFKSNAKTAKEFNYCKPTILKTAKKGLVRAADLRHPIIERITEVEYIPHNIKLGKADDNPLDGMLIYGINSAGKSSLMKAVGMSVIMAQCGMFVPAREFSFSPYTALFSRITKGDNLFKGLSSFAVELVEIDSILKRIAPTTLVIGDEIASGSTDSVSGHALVASTLVALAKSGSSFIFATHLHEIPKIKAIKELDNIKPFHLTVTYDEKKDKLIFDRILKDGQGDSIYGVVVAKYFIQNKDFMKLANDICNELSQTENKVMAERKSKYNSKLYVDHCSVCHKKDKKGDEYYSYLDTHHINFQKDCKNGFVVMKPHIPTNSLPNLVNLCKKCHSDVHKGKINIQKYVQTSHGKELLISK